MKKMKNSKIINRREFFNRFTSNDSESLLNPFNSLTPQFNNTLTPIEPEVLFLNRSSFGIRPVDYVRVKSIGIENYLEEQLDYESIDNSELDELLGIVYPLVNSTLPEIVSYIEEGNLLGEDRFADAAVQLISSTMMRQLYSKHQLFEVMVEFWNNHFNVDIIKDLDLILKVYEDKHVIRTNALSSFSEILHADSKSAAMMFYLDNYTNTKDGPNENYARELLELHTLGVDRGYTENDIKEVARCFTGWSIGQNDGDFFEFYDSDHDNDMKMVMGQVINNSDGIRDGEQVLDMLAYSSTTAGFISEKLVRRFCSDIPNERLVQIVAKKYLSTQGDIKEMLRSIFHSNEFLASVDDKFKRPIEFVSSLIRAVDTETSQQNMEQKFYPLYVLFKEYEDAGQIPFLWSPPTGYPDVAGYWKNISALLHRINFANGVAFGDLNFVDGDGDQTLFSDLIDYNYLAIIQDAQSATEIVTTIENSLLYRELLPADKLLLIDFLESENNAISEQRVRAIIGILLSSTYFQLR